MKQNPQSALPIFFLLLIFFSLSTASARILSSKQGDQQDSKASWAAQAGAQLVEIKEEDPLNLLELEKCDDKDEECLNRRMAAEAHLDYIYTQHHKP